MDGLTVSHRETDNEKRTDPLPTHPIDSHGKALIDKQMHLRYLFISNLLDGVLRAIHKHHRLVHLIMDEFGCGLICGDMPLLRI